MTLAGGDGYGEGRWPPGPGESSLKGNRQIQLWPRAEGAGARPAGWTGGLGCEGDVSKRDIGKEGPRCPRKSRSVGSRAS